jgi:hypothetical protein
MYRMRLDMFSQVPELMQSEEIANPM